MKALLLGLLRGYKLLLSPMLYALFGTACRFEPSCADYMQQAIVSHGVRRGGWLGVKRLCRCHPWSGCSGYDPVSPVGFLQCDEIKTK